MWKHVETGRCAQVRDMDTSFESIERKLDKLLEQFSELERRIQGVEESMSQLADEKQSRIRLSPRKGQPIVPNLYRDIYPDTSAIFSISDVEVDVTPIINDSLKSVIHTINEIQTTGEKASTAVIADQIRLSRSTVSGRLNMLHRLGLVEKEQSGRTVFYIITEKGERFLKNE